MRGRYRHASMEEVMKNVALVTVASLVLFACSSEPAPPTVAGGQKTNTSTSPTERNGEDDDGAPSQGTNGAPGTGGTGAGTGTSPGGAAPGAPGAPADGEEACFDACEAQNAAGTQVMDGLDDQWTTCVCGACAAACGQSLCAANPTEPADGDACDTCMQNQTACDDAWENACNANADCQKLDQCQMACEPADDQQADDADDGQKTAKAYSTRTHATRSVLRTGGATRVILRTR
jgi:hypothetical protein